MLQLEIPDFATLRLEHLVLDVIARDIGDALDLLVYPQRLIATLRG